MRTLTLLVPCAAALCLALAPAPQERVKPETPKKFEESLRAVDQAWKSASYGTALKELRHMTMLVGVKRTEAIIAALPKAPAGFEAVPDKTREDLANNPQAAAMAGAMGMVGTLINHRYKATEGRDSIDVSITADSPLLGMFQMIAANPQALGANKELIKYGAHKAILDTTNKNRVKLQIMIGESTLCDVTVTGRDDDFLFAMWDQSAVDQLAAALSR